LTTGELVPIAPLSSRGDYVGAFKKGREVRWVADSEARVAPSKSVSLALRPRCDDDLVEHLEEMGEASSGRVGAAMVKKNAWVDLASWERVGKTSYWPVTVTAQGPFQIAIDEGTVVLKTCVPP
jgi:hypothetical protein